MAGGARRAAAAGAPRACGGPLQARSGEAAHLPGRDAPRGRRHARRARARSHHRQGRRRELAAGAALAVADGSRRAPVSRVAQSASPGRRGRPAPGARAQCDHHPGWIRRAGSRGPARGTAAVRSGGQRPGRGARPDADRRSPRGTGEEVGIRRPRARRPDRGGSVLPIDSAGRRHQARPRARPAEAGGAGVAQGGFSAGAGSAGARAPAGSGTARRVGTAAAERGLLVAAAGRQHRPGRWPRQRCGGEPARGDRRRAGRGGLARSPGARESDDGERPARRGGGELARGPRRGSGSTRGLARAGQPAGATATLRGSDPAERSPAEGRAAICVPVRLAARGEPARRGGEEPAGA